MANKIRRVAIVGGVRIPFARAFTAYTSQSNKDMMAAAIQGLSNRFGLKGEAIGEVQGGAVINQTRDFNLAREAVLSTDLSPMTTGTTLQVACGTSLAAAINLANKIALGQIDSGIACGADSISDSPLMFTDKFKSRMFKLNRARSLGQKLGAFKGFGFGELKPMPAGADEPRTKLTMGKHCELMAQDWDISREEQDAFAVTSHLRAHEAYESGFYDEQVVSHAGLVRDNNMRPDATVEGMAKLRQAFDRSSKGTLTAGNSTPLTDGASSVLLCSEEWAKERNLPIQAYITHSRISSVDFVEGEGLLMAPTVAVSEMLTQAKMKLQDFDVYEIHEAFAAQALCTLKAWEDETYCKERLGRKAAMGAIDRAKLNPKGSSLAYGHPFAATGARVLSNAAQQLAEAGKGKALLSVCTAGGMGVVATLEA